MPYGGKDEEKRKHYLSVFETIIAPAARNVGYEPRRSDVQGEAGAIPTEIIRSLAAADVVIADLSEGNANVFYELGVRHALRKRGTVHIINKEHPVPFDVAQYRLVEYSTKSFADIAPAVDAISKAIKQREEETGISDNLVHDTLPNLPINVTNLGADEVQKQVAELQSQLAAISDEREKLRRELEALRPTPLGDIVDVDTLLEEANTAREFSGDNAYLRLVSAISTGAEEELDAFIKELRLILKSPYLTRADFLRISRLCKRVGLGQHSRVVLEVARNQYADDLDILIALVDAYQESPNPAHQLQGRQLIENFLFVQHTPDGPRMQQRPVGNVYSAAITLFNFYLINGQFGWVVSLAESLEEQMGESNIAARNKARALHRLGRTKEALEEFERAIKLGPSDDVTYKFYADYLDDDRKYAEAYEAYEKSVTCDPRDGSSFLSLANHIMLRGYARNATGKIVGPLALAERQRVAVPLYLRALNDEYRDMRPSVTTALASYRMGDLAQRLMENESIPDDDWDNSALVYLNTLIETANS
jgi:tetratricopeptide (TPR) repeat protein